LYERNKDGVFIEEEKTRLRNLKTQIKICWTEGGESGE
jgi:hypothetical protein